MSLGNTGGRVPYVDTSKVAYEEVGGGGSGFFCFIPCASIVTKANHALIDRAWDFIPRLNKDGHIEFSVLSYNLFIRPPGVKNNADDFKLERLGGFIDEIHNFDIVGLQEIFSTFSNRQAQLIDEAKKRGFKYHVKPKPHGALSPFLVDGGLLLLSKYPVMEEDGIIYIQGVQSDGLASKGVIYARIQLDDSVNSTVHVFVTHTQASYTSSNPSLAKKSEDIRLKQLDQLYEFVKKKMSKYPNTPGIILGDLNVNARKYLHSETEESDEYIKMMQIFSKGPSFTFQDLLKEEHKGHPVTYGDVIYEDRYSDPPVMRPKETALTHTEDLCTLQRLDYIFLVQSTSSVHESVSSSSIDDEGSDNNEHLSELKGLAGSANHQVVAELGYTSYGVAPTPKKQYFKVKPKSTKVEPFLVNGKGFTQLSDHYGVSTRLIYSKHG